MALMIVSTTLMSDLLIQLMIRSIFTNFATIFSHSNFSSFGTHFIKSADIVNDIDMLSFLKSFLTTVSSQLNSNILPVQGGIRLQIYFLVGDNTGHAA